MQYATGDNVSIGDRVSCDGEPALVEDVIESGDEMVRWGLSEQGVMLRSQKLGLFFQAQSQTAWHEVVVQQKAPERNK